MAIRQKGPRLGDCFLEHHRTKTTFLDEINELINWREPEGRGASKIRHSGQKWPGNAGIEPRLGCKHSIKSGADG